MLRRSQSDAILAYWNARIDAAEHELKSYCRVSYDGQRYQDPNTDTIAEMAWNIKKLKELRDAAEMVETVPDPHGLTFEQLEALKDFTSFIRIRSEGQLKDDDSFKRIAEFWAKELDRLNIPWHVQNIVADFAFDRSKADISFHSFAHTLDTVKEMTACVQ